MASSNLIIKIKIEDHSYTKEDWKSIGRWEDEGGTPLNKKETDLSAPLPLKPGQIFEVLNGDIVYEKGQPYYAVSLNLLALR